MKKFLGILLAMLVLSMAAFAADITVTLNGEAIDFADQAPEIVEGRTLVPLRAIFEALGASVEWDQATKTVTSSMDDVTVKLTIGDNTLYRNGEGVTLDVAAQILNGRTMVPARAIAEAYGVDVQWDAATRTVVLTKEAQAKKDGVVKYSEAYVTGSDGLQTVADPADASNEVYFMESNAGTNTSWNYFWIPGNFKPGEKYLVDFDVYLATDALGGEITEENPSVGICFSYGDTNCVHHPDNAEGKTQHHGSTIDKKSSSVYPGVKTWTHAYYVFEMPETLNVDAKMDFGIYANPVVANGYAEKLAVNFYLDNVSVELYEGPAENGIHTEESLKVAENKASFDFATAQGLVFDLNEDKDEFAISATAYEYVDGNLIVTAEGENADPTITLKDCGMLTADKYNAVAVRFKAEGVLEDQRHIVVYFATEYDDSLSQSKSITVKYDLLEVDEDGYYFAYIFMPENPAWDGQITKLRIDPGNSMGLYTIDSITVLEK